MRKILLTMALMLVACVTMRAQDVQRLVVWQKSGEKVYIDLAEQPETTFAGGNLVITTSTTTVRYPISNVLRYTYEGEMTAIETPDVKPGEIIFRQGADQMTFDGLPEGVRLEVYSMDGKQLFVETSQKGKTTVVSLANYPAGIYIVKSGDATYKILKR